MTAVFRSSLFTEIVMSESSLTEDSSNMPASTRGGIEALFLALAVVAFVGARLWHLTSYGIFGDEVFTLWTSAQSWPSLFASVVEDVVHPPLFYALLKIWIDIGGQSLLWIKLLPVLLSILSLIPFLLLCRQMRINRMTTSLALWLMAVNGFLIGHAQESRMYSLLLLLALSSLWLFAKLQQAGNRASGIYFGLLGVNLLLVFSHYFGWVVVALEFVFIVIWRRDLALRFALATFAVAICFSPWAYLVVRSAKANPSRATFFWNRPPPASELIGYYANLNGPLSYKWKVFGTAVVMLLFLSPIIAKLVRTLRNRQRTGEVRLFWFLILFGFAPVALGFIASHVLPQSVWALRYLIIAAPAYLLLVAVAAVDLKQYRFGVIVIVLIAGWATLSGFTEMLNRNRISWEPLVKRMIEAEHEQSDQIENDALSTVNVVVADPNVGNTVQFYLDKAGETHLRVDSDGNFNSPTGKHAWVALIRYNHESQPPLQVSLTEAGYRVGDVIEATAAGQTAAVFPVWKP